MIITIERNFSPSQNDFNGNPIRGGNTVIINPKNVATLETYERQIINGPDMPMQTEMGLIVNGQPIICKKVILSEYGKARQQVQELFKGIASEM